MSLQKHGIGHTYFCEPEVKASSLERWNFLSRGDRPSFLPVGMAGWAVAAPGKALAGTPGSPIKPALARASTLVLSGQKEGENVCLVLWGKQRMR